MNSFRNEESIDTYRWFYKLLISLRGWEPDTSVSISAEQPWGINKIAFNARVFTILDQSRLIHPKLKRPMHFNVLSCEQNHSHKIRILLADCEFII